jgi:poly-beta-1,6-N-acetyl-D-glucosamine biosynthesis protein PgaD
MSAKRFIIDDASVKSPFRRGLEALITLGAWSVWGYLVSPLATLALWAVGIKLVLVQQTRLSGMEGLRSVVLYYIAGALIIFLTMHLWNMYNRRKFGGLDRRKSPSSVAPADLAAHYQVPPDTLDAAMAARRVIVHFEGDHIRLETPQE